MPWHERAAAYVEAVCGQVRWKKARPAIAAELIAHVEDQAAAYEAAGMQPEEAWEKAIAAMGDPIHTGALLDASYRPQLPWPVLFALGGLVILGLLTRTLALGQPFDGKQALALLLALGGFFLFYNLDWRWLIKGTWAAYALILLSVLPRHASRMDLAAFPASAWAYYSVLLFPAVYALIIYRCRGKGWEHILMCGAAFCLPGCLLLRQPDFNIFLLLALPCLALLTMAIWAGYFKTPRWKALLLVWAPTAAVAVLLFLSNYYFTYRLEGILHPERNPTGSGYLPLLLRGYLNGARLFGQGALAGIAEASALEGFSFRTDYALTYCIHRFGWWVFIALAGVLGWLFWRLFRACRRQTSMLGRLLGYGAALTLAFQFAGYFLSNLGLCVVSTMPLPFLAYGNSSLVVNACLAGLLVSVMAGGSVLRDGVFRAGPLFRLPDVMRRFFEEEA